MTELEPKALAALRNKALEYSREVPMRPCSPYGYLMPDHSAITDAFRQMYEVLAALTPAEPSEPTEAQVEAACDAMERSPYICPEKRENQRLLARHILRAALAHPAPVGEAAATHRHKKRGTEYVLIGYGKMQAEHWVEPEMNRQHAFNSVDMREVAVYRSIDDGSLWVRPRKEFEDGRFMPLPAAPQPWVIE